MSAGASPAEVEELIRLRRDFHRNPELAYQERRTSGIVAARMEDLGYDVETGVGGTGVLAGRGEGPTVLLRADMDALPIREATGAEYQSVNEGVMHACGHDGHTAIALMAAARLARTPLPGRVRFAFQPAEEGGQGADAMIAGGALDGVDAAFGLHLWNWLPVGRISITSGPVMAACDEFTIVIRGRGGHAAKPHEAEDPVVRAAQVIQEIQTIASRRVDPLDAVVVTVTSVHGGAAFNVIPEEVALQGTIRTFDEGVQEDVHRRLREIVAEKGTVEISRITRPLVNDPEMCELARQAAGAVVGKENVLEGRPTMTGEDFASFAARVPSCFVHVGSGGPGARPHHHPEFDIDERSLGIGLDVLCRCAALFLERGPA